MAEVKDPSDTGGRLIAASQVKGTNVYNRAGEVLTINLPIAKAVGRVFSIHDTSTDGR